MDLQKEKIPDKVQKFTLFKLCISVYMNLKKKKKGNIMYILFCILFFYLRHFGHLFMIVHTDELFNMANIR